MLLMAWNVVMTARGARATGEAAVPAAAAAAA
jgi:hypothetical protein